MQRLLLLGLNHTTAPLEVRERLAFDADQHRRAVESFRARFPGCEVVLLSTCNRVELYVARPETTAAIDAELFAEFFTEFHRLPAAQVRPA